MTTFAIELYNGYDVTFLSAKTESPSPEKKARAV